MTVHVEAESHGYVTPELAYGSRWAYLLVADSEHNYETVVYHSDYLYETGSQALRNGEWLLARIRAWITEHETPT